jgi:hypothetical protein
MCFKPNAFSTFKSLIHLARKFGYPLKIEGDGLIVRLHGVCH